MPFLNWLCCTFHGTGSLVYSDSGLISESVNPFRYFCRTP